LEGGNNMEMIAGLVIGLFLGAATGVVVMGLCVASRNTEDLQEAEYLREHSGDRKDSDV